MSILKFLGNGSAFNYESFNTAAYIDLGEDLILIDVGESICNELIKHHLLENRKNVYILITHTHSDHIGSLEPLLYYNYNFLKTNFQVFYKKRCNLHKLLCLTGIDFKFKVYPFPKELSGFKLDYVEQKHIPGSYGFFFYGKENFFFSGDTSVINQRAVEELKSGKLDYLYHEVSFSGSKIHTQIEKLEETFPKEIRNKVYLMHFENKEDIEKVKALGFNVGGPKDE